MTLKLLEDVHFFFCFWRYGPPVGQSLLIYEFSRSHTTHHSRLRLLWTSDQPVVETSSGQHAVLKTDINVPGRIWTRNLSRRGAADLRLRPRGHWDWLLKMYICTNKLNLPSADCRKLYLLARHQLLLDVWRSSLVAAQHRAQVQGR
jgi:hypothetical protein